ncbi:hypothetical protein B0181_08940 [Moraxella caviae]|uniref:Uncharacterized protein n=1 Tax=Moraxella caviae TaxID=34060 RepID=A0A1S9ZXD5_9GAMM|nr:hypothetical protein [Moraxella caviae]OOR88069.1 hypothetical protein B0181_08940 [Moraxella caviae]STZ09991.1 Uncharacterised protein [Moraxella caviae]VEW12958.1 Uncharacterised protein [Moraxella caviae]
MKFQRFNQSYAKSTRQERGFVLAAVLVAVLVMIVLAALAIRQSLHDVRVAQAGTAANELFVQADLPFYALDHGGAQIALSERGVFGRLVRALAQKQAEKQIFTNASDAENGANLRKNDKSLQAFTTFCYEPALAGQNFYADGALQTHATCQPAADLAAHKAVVIQLWVAASAEEAAQDFSAVATGVSADVQDLARLADLLADGTDGGALPALGVQFNVYSLAALVADKSAWQGAQACFAAVGFDEPSLDLSGVLTDCLAKYDIAHQLLVQAYEYH